MNACYIDCFSGASGDKVVAAFLDLGMPVEYLHEQLAAVRLADYRVDVESVLVYGIAATRMTVQVTDAHVVRTWASVRELIEGSELALVVKDKALAIFGQLARAEAKLHARPLDLVHFHEIGAVDSIVDVVGAAASLAFFGLERVVCSPVAVGSGMVRAEHGMLPVPAPATLEILTDIPIYSGGVTSELTTPTGAAILKECVDSYGEMPPLRPTAVGYGAGTRDLEIPNVLRIVLGELAGSGSEKSDGAESDRVTVIETTVDNTSPQILGAVFDMLLEAGALDVWTVPVQMKKQRPGVLVTVLARPSDASGLQDILLRETDTIGLRVREESRVIAHREIVKVKTSLGVARVKVARRGGEVVSVMPEFDDVKRLAAKKKTPMKVAFDRVKQEAEAKLLGE